MQEQALVATRKERDRVANLLKARYQVLLDRKLRLAEEGRNKHATVQTKGTRETTLQNRCFLKGALNEVRRTYKEITGRELDPEG